MFRVESDQMLTMIRDGLAQCHIKFELRDISHNIKTSSLVLLFLVYFSHVVIIVLLDGLRLRFK